jgi:hypothetical protein
LLVSAIRRGKRGLRHRQACKDHEHRSLAHRRAGIGGSPGQQFVEVNRAIRTRGEAGGIDRGDGGKALLAQGFGFAAMRFALSGHRIDEGLGVSGGLGSPVLDGLEIDAVYRLRERCRNRGEREEARNRSHSCL